MALILVSCGAGARCGCGLAVEYTGPVVGSCLLLVGVGLFVLRAREPDVARPFRVPFYPVLPATFCGTSLYLLYSSVAYTGIGALVGSAVLAIGAVLLRFLHPLPPAESD